MKYEDTHISYNESCFIVNAIDFYIANFKSQTSLSKESLNDYMNIKTKYEKLEPQILNLQIKE